MGCSLQDIVSWYQKKIGTYDKQPWEKTVEQHILSGFMPIPKKTAKLKTELIDIDLIRGSSFTKAKPKHGLMTVTRLAVMRLVFLPFYSDWWTQQSSFTVFAGLLFLYMLQCVNMILYFCLCPHHPENDVERLNLSEVLVPLAMMLGLSIIHSQIVSPYPCVNQCALNKKARRTKRSKRRPTPLPRYRSTLGSDSKSSPDTSSELTKNTSGNKYRKRVRLRNVSPEDSLFSRNKKPQPPVVEVKEPYFEDPRFCSKVNPVSVKEVRIVEEASLNRPSQEDDGFESLNGNGSSDNNEEEAKSTSGNNNGDTQELQREGVLNVSQVPPSSPSSDVFDLRGCDGEVDETDHKDTDSEPSRLRSSSTSQKLLNRRRGSLQSLNVKLAESSYNSSGESDDGETVPDLTTSAAEWIGITTNSEECSYSSDMDDHVPANNNEVNDHPFAWEFQISPAAILSPSCASSDKVSCTMWDKREVKKAELSVLDISSAIIARVEGMPENLDYFFGGLFAAVLLAVVPSLCRLSNTVIDVSTVGVSVNVSTFLSSSSFLPESLDTMISSAFGTTPLERTIILIALLERCFLGAILFFLLAVAERTFKQRFLYAKFFSHLTSFRRARKSELPHFRLNKVRNIKTWLSVRSYLKKRGPQRSVDVVVSAAFIITLLLLSFLSVELLKDSEQFRSIYNMEAVAWSLVLGVFLLRFMTLGTKINRKYRNLSVLITEQINLYLQIEQKPNKKDELMVANSVLKLAADLLKELESPFKISGLSANPYLYTITKVVILSALSGVLSEMLGFKLKLHKIKIK